jgi:DMSO/TMAO reductase YedYZ molybdopterin-dependent catalytic subunit
VSLVLYQQSIRLVPHVHLNHWSFAITGGVQHPLILSFADLGAYATQTLRCVLACAGDSRDRPLINEAVWRGVSMKVLLDELVIAPGMDFARVYAADGYTTVLPLDRLAQTLLAYEMDGTVLLPEHGFPARLIAPGLHGYKMAKWIERIELSALPTGGFWESRGFSLEGEAAVKVALLSHEQAANGVISFAGIAYVGVRPIQSVQVSIDGGDWMPVPFIQDDPITLAHWHIDWMPPDAGVYHIRARASDGRSDAEHTLVVRSR